MGRATKDLALGSAEVLRDLIEARSFGERQGAHAFAAVAIDPFHLTRFLAGCFDQIAEESVFVFGQIHVGFQVSVPARRVKAGGSKIDLVLPETRG